jgi:hypothetical protein
MRHLLTTLAAAAFVVGSGLALAPAHAAPLPQLNGPNAESRRSRQLAITGTATAITLTAAITGIPGITGLTPTAITGRIATDIGTGPIIAVTGSPRA